MQVRASAVSFLSSPSLTQKSCPLGAGGGEDTHWMAHPELALGLTSSSSVKQIAPAGKSGPLPDSRAHLRRGRPAGSAATPRQRRGEGLWEKRGSSPAGAGWKPTSQPLALEGQVRPGGRFISHQDKTEHVPLVTVVPRQKGILLGRTTNMTDRLWQGPSPATGNGSNVQVN